MVYVLGNRQKFTSEVVMRKVTLLISILTAAIMLTATALLADETVAEKQEQPAQQEQAVDQGQPAQQEQAPQSETPVPVEQPAK